jgi:hypothetical protein
MKPWYLPILTIFVAVCITEAIAGKVNPFQNSIREQRYENRRSYLQCCFVGILLHGHADRWAPKGRRYSSVGDTVCDANTQRGGDWCPIFTQPRRETHGIGEQCRMAWARLLANHGQISFSSQGRGTD